MRTLLNSLGKRLESSLAANTKSYNAPYWPSSYWPGPELQRRLTSSGGGMLPLTGRGY